MNAHAYMQTAKVMGLDGSVDVQIMHANRAPIRGFKFSRAAKLLLKKIKASQDDNKICAIQPGDLVNILPRELYQIACRTGASFVKPMDDTPSGHRAAAMVASQLKEVAGEPMPSFSGAMQDIIQSAKQKTQGKPQQPPQTSEGKQKTGSQQVFDGENRVPAADGVPATRDKSSGQGEQLAPKPASQPVQAEQKTGPAKTKPQGVHAAAKIGSQQVFDGENRVPAEQKPRDAPCVPRQKPAFDPGSHQVFDGENRAPRAIMTGPRFEDFTRRIMARCDEVYAESMPPLVDLNEHENLTIWAAAMLGKLQRSDTEYESDSDEDSYRQIDHWRQPKIKK